MNKLITIFTVFFFITGVGVVLGQDAVKTGAKGGLNFASITNDNIDTRTGFLIGGFAKFGIPDSRLSIQPEIFYSQQGGKSGDNEIRLDYLKVPVLFKYSLTSQGTASPNIFAGPYAGLRLVAEQEGAAGGFIGGGTTNIENETESVDYGFVFGAGIDIDVGNSIFTMDARYSPGLADVFNNQSGKHSVISVTFGISLPSSASN